MKLSVSSINSFLQCPYRFYLEKIKHIKLIKIPKQLEEGSQIHEIFDKAVKNNNSEYYRMPQSHALPVKNEGNQRYN